MFLNVVYYVVGGGASRFEFDILRRENACFYMIYVKWLFFNFQEVVFYGFLFLVVVDGCRSEFDSTQHAVEDPESVVALVHE